jgi:N-acyl-D-amino-acid deacylase
MFDLIIKNGTVVDGSGTPAFRADVAISGQKIKLVGNSGRSDARRVIDASGRVVSPGFIDMHSHSDIPLLINPREESKIMQGVTTELIGQDGLSYAPVDDVTLPILRKTLAGVYGDSDAIDWNWTSVGDFLSRFDRKVAVNVCYLVPHGAVRLLAVGPEDRVATDKELERMKELVAEGMSEGAVGFSTGLTYPLCAFADTRELIACCEGIAPTGGFFAPHLRSYGPRLQEAIEEALQVGRDASVPVHFTHFHCSYEFNKNRAVEFLARLDRAQAEGIEITFDSYPYTAGATFLGGIFPSWVHGGGPKKFLERISSRALRERIRHEMEEEGCDGYSHVPIDWKQVVIGGVGSQQNEWAVGRSVAELGVETGKRPIDLVCDLLFDDNLGVSCLAFFGHETNVRIIMKHPSHMVGSDGGLIGSRPHPRAYGTFARYLQCYTRELKVLTLEECIRKMTSLPAARLGLSDRGLVREGMAADLVIFDFQRLEDTATYENPRSHPRGIDFVLVNGTIVVDEGRHTGFLAGRVLERTSRSPQYRSVAHPSSLREIE